MFITFVLFWPIILNVMVNARLNIIILNSKNLFINHAPSLSIVCTNRSILSGNSLVQTGIRKKNTLGTFFTQVWANEILDYIYPLITAIIIVIES